MIFKTGTLVALVALSIVGLWAWSAHVPEVAARGFEYPNSARLDGQLYGGPSIRFYQTSDNTIAYDLDYGTGWRNAGNLGATLQDYEAVSAMYFDGYVYVFISNRTTGHTYYKRSQPDAGVASFGQTWSVFR